MALMRLTPGSVGGAGFRVDGEPKGKNMETDLDTGSM